MLSGLVHSCVHPDQKSSDPLRSIWHLEVVGEPSDSRCTIKLASWHSLWNIVFRNAASVTTTRDSMKSRSNGKAAAFHDARFSQNVQCVCLVAKSATHSATESIAEHWHYQHAVCWSQTSRLRSNNASSGTRLTSQMRQEVGAIDNHHRTGCVGRSRQLLSGPQGRRTWLAASLAHRAGPRSSCDRWVAKGALPLLAEFGICSCCHPL